MRADPALDAAMGALPGASASDPPPAELGTVTVVAPRYEDRFAFRNPIDARGTRFERDWRGPISAESIGMQGGIVYLGINYGLMKVAEHVTHLPGWKHQVRPATARPHPLDEAQMRRALHQRTENPSTAASPEPAG